MALKTTKVFLRNVETLSRANRRKYPEIRPGSPTHSPCWRRKNNATSPKIGRDCTAGTSDISGNEIARARRVASGNLVLSPRGNITIRPF